MPKQRTQRFLSFAVVFGIALSFAAGVPAQDVVTGEETKVSNRRRREAARKAVAWLAENMDKCIKRTPNLELAVIRPSLIGLAFLSEGKSWKKGHHAEATSRCIQIVTEKLEAYRKRSDGGKLNKESPQMNWAYSHGVIFLCEAYAQENGPPELKDQIQRFVNVIEMRQTSLGGWCHGVGAFDGYEEFTPPTIFCLAALSYARMIDCNVSDEKIENGINYIMESSGPDGVVGYSRRHRQRGSDLTKFHGGRTGGGIFAFAATGHRNHPFFDKMASYHSKHIEEVEGGHASPVLHSTMAALGALALGANDWQLFWNTWGEKIIQRQQEDGRIPPIGNWEKYFPDRLYLAGEAGGRSTATFAVILNAPDMNLRLLGRASGYLLSATRFSCDAMLRGIGEVDRCRGEMRAIMRGQPLKPILNRLDLYAEKKGKKATEANTISKTVREYLHWQIRLLEKLAEERPATAAYRLGEIYNRVREMPEEDPIKALLMPLARDARVVELVKIIKEYEQIQEEVERRGLSRFRAKKLSRIREKCEGFGKRMDLDEKLKKEARHVAREIGDLLKAK